MSQETTTSDAVVFKSVPLPKLGSGVDGLDEVLEGGYPRGRTTLLKGGPGAGKSLFALQFLQQHALGGSPGIFVTFEESADAVRTNAATLGWDLPALEAKGLLFIYRVRLDTAAVNAGRFSLGAMMAILEGKSRAMGGSLLVIDAIDILMRRFEDPGRIRDELSSLHEWLEQKKLTTIVSVKSTEEIGGAALGFGFLDYLADCVLQLDHRVLDQISTRRLRVLKYRGSAFGSNEFPYVIRDGGISLVRIASAQLSHRALGAYRSSGNAELDAVLNGGYRRNACILIAGPSGSGKTTIACTFVQAMCSRNEKALYISFEESPDALESAVKSVGIQLGPEREGKRLELLCRLPESTGSDEHLFQHIEAIRAFQPDAVVIDAISACDRMGSGKAPFDYCMRLVNACREEGITCLLINQIGGRSGNADLSGIGFTSLVDTVIELRFEEHDSELRRTLVVRKARGCKHSPRVFDLGITDDGITVRSKRRRRPRFVSSDLRSGPTRAAS